MNKFPVFKSLLVAFGFILVLSCDKDFNEVGANLVGDDSFVFERSDDFTVKCFNQFDEVVQTDNLPINSLGVYEHDSFGTSISSFVTQLEIPSTNGVLNTPMPTEAIIDEVILSVPYFSKLNSGSTDAYTLDSISGNGKIKLSIYETTKFLESLEGNSIENKKYYSDQLNDFSSLVAGNVLNDSQTLSENSEFIFSNTQQTEVVLEQVTNNGVTTTAEKTNAVSPRMKLKLNKTHFQNKLVGTIPASKMISNSVFKEYFRGLLFKVEQFENEKSLAQLDFSKGRIIIYYKLLETDAVRKIFTLNLAGNRVNFYKNSYTATGLPTSSSPTEATNNLYLKGGAGFHSYIDLFGTANAQGEVERIDGVKAKLDEIKANKWIINEANIVFTATDNKTHKERPNRLYLFDAKNKRPLIDYLTDPSASASKPKYNKITHSGIKYLENGLTKYKIRITNHIKNIVNKDSTIVRLGLVITEDINNVRNQFIKSVASDKYYNRIPTSSVINPLGTILYGSDTSIEESKRVKLEIFYTKPN